MNSVTQILTLFFLFIFIESEALADSLGTSSSATAEIVVTIPERINFDSNLGSTSDSYAFTPTFDGQIEIRSAAKKMYIPFAHNELVKIPLKSDQVALILPE